MGRTHLSDKTELWGNVGTDLQYGISSGISLDFTINPDFGQVEADPATLNLSAYEEFFNERRSFFVKGAWIFTNLEYRFLYSRRIGHLVTPIILVANQTAISMRNLSIILGRSIISEIQHFELFQTVIAASTLSGK